MTPPDGSGTSLFDGAFQDSDAQGLDLGLGSAPPESSAPPLDDDDSTATIITEADPDTVARPLAEPIDGHLPRVLSRQCKAERAKDPPQTYSGRPHSAAQILLERADRRRPVAVTFTDRDGASTRVVLGQGRLLACHRFPQDPNRDSVADRMRKAGSLDIPTWKAVRQEHEETGKPFEVLLADRVDKRLMGVAMREVMQETLERCFCSRSLETRVDPASSLLRELVPLPVPLTRACYRALLAAAEEFQPDLLKKGLAGYRDHHVIRVEPPPLDANTLGLDEVERRFWEVSIDQPVQITHLLKISALGQAQTLRTLYALLWLGMIQLQANYVPPDAELLGPIRNAWSRMQGASPYDVLQVHWTALPAEIEKGYQKQVRRWQTAESPPQVTEAFDDLRDQILRKVRKAYRYLSDDRRRRRGSGSSTSARPR
ncbi:MAG: J domain-containing protein [Alphaproteobacteria bacterium]|nr:J domain-containing protein [Alphaproteobacteria bacterium]